MRRLTYPGGSAGVKGRNRLALSEDGTVIERGFLGSFVEDVR